MRDQWSMSNSLKVSLQATIYSLNDRGWSRRRIARELGIDRETVGRYLLLAKPAISTTGLEEAGEAKPAILTAGLEEASEAKPAISTAGNGVGRKSQCEPLAEVIMAKAEVGLSAQRIYQDLVGENGFTDSYQSVKRFVRKLRAAQIGTPGRSDHGQGGGRAQRATYLPGFGGGKRLHRFLPIGEALCAQAASGSARADLAFGMPTGRRTPAGFRFGGADR